MSMVMITMTEVTAEEEITLIIIMEDMVEVDISRMPARLPARTFTDFISSMYHEDFRAQYSSAVLRITSTATDRARATN